MKRNSIQQAREELALGPTTRAEAWEVYPPEGKTASYFLVVFGDPGAATAAAAVDAQSGRVLSSARLPGVGPHLTVRAEDALKRAGLRGAAARLVWTPSRQSRSPLYPVWEVGTSEATVFVDQQGRVWTTLEAGGPGGAS